MAKVKNPTTFSQEFGIKPGRLEKLDVLDATLAIDTGLFIDPLLLAESSHDEISGRASQLYTAHFQKIIKLLSHSRREGDVAWRAAQILMELHEVPGTCLGYGAATIRGRGWGAKTTNTIVAVAKEIVDLGIEDPDLFAALALFESKMGPDRISDMTTNIILPALEDYNRRVLKSLKLTADTHDVSGTNYDFLTNPLETNPTPLILVPTDILRVLPIATDWDEVADAASHNTALRKRVNKHITEIWKAKTKREKEELKKQALSSKAAFETLLSILKEVPREAYDAHSDPEGLNSWARAAQLFASKYPLDLSDFDQPQTADDVENVVSKIIDKFEQLIERNGLNKELYKVDGSPRHESTAQRLFFAVAYAYCEANNLDVSPEVDTGSGKVDFKFSKGFEARALVEIKLSTNTKLVSGFDKQLEAYKVAEETSRAFYLVIDVGRMGKKDEALLKLKNDAADEGQKLSTLRFVDGTKKKPGSKR